MWPDEGVKCCWTCRNIRCDADIDVYFCALNKNMRVEPHDIPCEHYGGKHEKT